MSNEKTIDDLRILQSLPLHIKVLQTVQRLLEAVYQYGTDGLYVSFSGGKDSTVLLDIVRKEFGTDIPAVFVNTGLEYPEIQTFAKSKENVVVLRPKMHFDEVVTKYGYPFVSKDVSRKIYYAKKGSPWALNEMCGRSSSGDESRFYQRFKKWKPLVDVGFVISEECCGVMKKGPLHNYEREKKRIPIIGTLAEESVTRTQSWLKNGCNAFDAKRPMSRPLSFWTEQDVLRYIKENKLEIASVYGDIVATDKIGNEYDDTLLDGCKYKTTKCDRTGCIFCGFGAHLEKGEGRFERLKRTHPRQYEYCMGGGAYAEDGLWKPTKEGLGMAHCIDEINKLYGKDFIRY